MLRCGICMHGPPEIAYRGNVSPRANRRSMPSLLSVVGGACPLEAKYVTEGPVSPCAFIAQSGMHENTAKADCNGLVF